MLHQDACNGRVQQSGQDARGEQDGRAVAQATASQQVGVIADVRFVADVLQAAQVPAGCDDEAPKQCACTARTFFLYPALSSCRPVSYISNLSHSINPKSRAVVTGLCRNGQGECTPQ